MKKHLFDEFNDIIQNLKYGNDYYEPLDLHSINGCYEFINWMPELDERIEINALSNGFLSICFRKDLDNAEIVFDKDYIIWVRNENQRVTSGKMLKGKYSFYHVLSEVLKIFE